MTRNIRYRIGEVSDITGISKDTLHFYAREGVVVPDEVDPDNGYRYYSLRNMWQLDVVKMCRGLDIPLSEIRAIFKLRDNEQITRLLASHYDDAVRKAETYARIAEDIRWYECQHEQNTKDVSFPSIQVKNLSEDIVLSGASEHNNQTYHTDVQKALKAMGGLSSIRRTYGYVLNITDAQKGRFTKEREYIRAEGLKPGDDYRLVLPAGEYAVMRAHVSHGACDLSALFQWAEDHHQAFDLIFAEEEGLQLFDYEACDCLIKAHLKNNP